MFILPQANMGRGPYGPGPIWAQVGQGPSGTWPKWARAQVGQGPTGPRAQVGPGPDPGPIFLIFILVLKSSQEMYGSLLSAPLRSWS